MNRYFYRTLIFLTFLSTLIYSQQEFNPDVYKQFLESNQNLSATDLLKMHPAGVFKANQNFSPEHALYFDSINAHYNLTASEISLIRENGFAVTERLSQLSFGKAFLDIWKKDLPVFISTDAIMHAMHMSYDEILKKCEINDLIPRLKTLLNVIHQQMPDLIAQYSSRPEMTDALKDLDLYLAVSRKFFNNITMTYFPDNKDKVTEIISLIDKLEPRSYRLFSETARIIDFSQFKVRGHYTDVNKPILAKYFQAMIWLGRTELYLLAPRAIKPAPSFDDIRRQSVCIFLLHKAAENGKVIPLWKEIDSMLQFFVGESDNVTLDNVQTLKELASVNDPAELMDSLKLVSFQQTLKYQPFAYQKILSQIILTGFNEPDSIIPASAFLLFGQRFVVDSYVTAQVVFDRIYYNNQRVMRLLPSTLDILFALGNNAAAQILQSELNEYHYSTNLAALRYLVDSYQPDFWRGTLYNNWLNSIRTLNPPDDRSALPSFMQTAAYWQEKMNTQLASWSQLRHDNLLYAKQSYTGGTTCSFPYSYVEPIPEFYEVVKQYCQAGKEYFASVPNLSTSMAYYADYYFSNTAAICDTLKAISIKELNNIDLTEIEKSFLSRMMYEKLGCGEIVDGWYPRLFFTGDEALLKSDYIVADVHTVPTDEHGNPIGWILHAGTGPVNLGIFTAKAAGGQEIAFTGPVLSYYEHVTKNFFRFSDEEWAEAYDKLPTYRPSFVNSYMADKNGDLKPKGLNLITGVQEETNNENPVSYLLINNFPNPFNAATTFNFTVPEALSNSIVKLKIYNIQGELIKEIINEQLPAGNYFVRWNGTGQDNHEAASGIYVYSLQAGDKSLSGKMTLLK